MFQALFISPMQLRHEPVQLVSVFQHRPSQGRSNNVDLHLRNHLFELWIHEITMRWVCRIYVDGVSMYLHGYELKIAGRLFLISLLNCCIHGAGAAWELQMNSPSLDIKKNVSNQGIVHVNIYKEWSRNICLVTLKAKIGAPDFGNS